MNTYHVVGMDKETGQDRTIDVQASDPKAAELVANQAGLFVSEVKQTNQSPSSAPIKGNLASAIKAGQRGYSDSRKAQSARKPKKEFTSWKPKTKQGEIVWLALMLTSASYFMAGGSGDATVEGLIVAAIFGLFGMYLLLVFIRYVSYSFMTIAK